MTLIGVYLTMYLMYAKLISCNYCVCARTCVCMCILCVCIVYCNYNNMFAHTCTWHCVCVCTCVHVHTCEYVGVCINIMFAHMNHVSHAPNKARFGGVRIWLILFAGCTNNFITVKVDLSASTLTCFFLNSQTTNAIYKNMQCSIQPMQSKVNTPLPVWFSLFH